MTDTISERKIKVKNSLIELFRFLFALWVLYYHSFVPYKGEMFGQGYLAVEFFFVLPEGAELIRQLTTAAVNLLRLFLNRLNLHNLLFLKLGIEVSITLCRI